MEYRKVSLALTKGEKREFYFLYFIARLFTGTALSCFSHKLKQRAVDVDVENSQVKLSAK